MDFFYFRAELEANYAKGLNKLGNKLIKACAKDQGCIVSQVYRSIYLQ